MDFKIFEKHIKPKSKFVSDMIYSTPPISSSSEPRLIMKIERKMFAAI